MLQRGRALARAEIIQNRRRAPPLKMLQRGRALARAEISDNGVRVGRVAAASTGPRTCARGDAVVFDLRHRSSERFNGAALARAEMRASERISASAHVLQRGRALARAEIDPEADSRAAGRPASTGPRTCARGDNAAMRERSTFIVASTGPRTCARGDFEDKGDGETFAAASTGPRTCARGDDVAAIVRQPQNALQRGRALARAEMTTTLATAAFAPSLQRGRALARAEIAGLLRVLATGNVASTGPRTCARGDAAAVAETIGRRLLQRGRALARAEIPDGTATGAIMVYASTGPRTCARGDVAHHSLSQRRIDCFNGAAHLRARRSPTFTRPPSTASSFNGAAHLRARRCCGACL